MKKAELENELDRVREQRNQYRRLLIHHGVIAPWDACPHSFEDKRVEKGVALILDAGFDVQILVKEKTNDQD